LEKARVLALDSHTNEADDKKEMAESGIPKNLNWPFLL
jgi:hypothetical protein